LSTYLVGVYHLLLAEYSVGLVEKCWAKVKEALRTAKARTWDDLLNALGEALLSVTPEDAAAWFAHCGYALA
jgi:transposase